MPSGHLQAPHRPAPRHQVLQHGGHVGAGQGGGDLPRGPHAVAPRQDGGGRLVDGLRRLARHRDPGAVQADERDAPGGRPLPQRGVGADRRGEGVDGPADPVDLGVGDQAAALASTSTPSVRGSQRPQPTGPKKPMVSFLTQKRCQ
ncbi:hypothetical protein LUW77_30575 [Streptomyces radiopugnans]|nr:hypothetical protein LUW77_30575 [Streptomyces radiopugnans]